MPRRRTAAEIREARLLEGSVAVDAAFYAACEHSFEAFYRGIIIDGQHGAFMFDLVGQDFQRRCFQELTPSIQALRDGDMPECRRFWVERTKKASKDADLAVIVLWLVAFGNRPFHIQIGAANQAQANEILKRVSALLQHNNWLNERIRIIHNQIKSAKTTVSGQPMVECDIVATDKSGGKHGATPDLLILNEVTHIDHKWEYVETMFTNADGVARGIVIIATNAGFQGTKAHVWRQNALRKQMEDGSWQVHVFAKPAPWHSDATLRDVKARLPKSSFQRLWWGHWVSGKGDALDEDKLDGMFTLDGPTLQPEQGWEYVIGVDLGVKHDHTGVVVVGTNHVEQRAKIALWRRWKPVDGSGTNGGIDEVALPEVQKAIYHWYRLYRAHTVFYDPSQAILMIQQLQRQGVICTPIDFIASNLKAMAESFQAIISAGKLAAYDDADHSLRAEFAKFNIVEKSYGLRLEAISDETGHADVGTALIITMPYVRDALNGTPMLQPDEPITFNEKVPLTKEEIDTTPDELRELILMNDPKGLAAMGVPDTRAGIIGKDQQPVAATGPDKDIDDDEYLNSIVDWYR